MTGREPPSGPRRLGDERARYGRKSLREQVGDVLDWPRQHRVATGVILGFLVVGAALSATRGLRVVPENLAIGDCLFVLAGEPDDARPIGDERVVVPALLAGQAERAGCDASHGHEVSAIVTAAPEPTPSRAPGEIGNGFLDTAAMRALAQPVCEAAFAGYVGHALAGSRYVTFPVVPDAEGAEAWLDGGRRTVCLVARSDGQWMDHPARGSAE